MALFPANRYEGLGSWPTFGMIGTTSYQAAVIEPRFAQKSEMAIIFLEMIRMEKSWAKHVGTTKTIDY